MLNCAIIYGVLTSVIGFVFLSRASLIAAKIRDASGLVNIKSYNFVPFSRVVFEYKKKTGDKHSVQAMYVLGALGTFFFVSGGGVLIVFLSPAK